jgi:hypothetical protein
MLKQTRSQGFLRQDNAGKENIPGDHRDSPPISTPGRMQLYFRNGNTTGRLRKRASDMAFKSQQGAYSTPRSAPISGSPTASRSEDSPSEKARDYLVARLSRPFNMDVPTHNRPFDSMYLGKRTPGHPDTMGSSRLSVAQQIPEDCGGVDLKHTTDPASDQEIGFTSGSTTAGRSASKVLGLFSSRRMVSNFLKSRRGERSTSDGGQSVVGSSPAFI